MQEADEGRAWAVMAGTGVSGHDPEWSTGRENPEGLKKQGVVETEHEKYKICSKLTRKGIAKAVRFLVESFPV